MTLSEAASEAATLASLQATCTAGDDVSLPRVLAERAAHAAPQLANLGVATWDEATTVPPLHHEGGELMAELNNE